MKLNSKKIKTFIQKTSRQLAENTFLTISSLFIVVFILAGLIFYQYFILIQKTEPKVTTDSLQLQKETFDKTLQVWQQRENNFKMAFSTKVWNSSAGTSNFISSWDLANFWTEWFIIYTKKATISKATIFKTLIIGLMAGPAVSL